MIEKKKPTFGALGNPYGVSVPEEVADFFGAEAPAAEPVVQWNEDREAAARELAAKEAAARELAAKEAAARELAAKEAAARELAAREAAARELAARELAAREAAARVAPAKAVAGNKPAAAGRGAAEEPKGFAQTIRSHWDSLIDTLGIGGRSKSERAQGAEKPAPAPEPAARTTTQRRTPSGDATVGRGDGGVVDPLEREVRSARTERPPRATVPAKTAPIAPQQEIPADAFGLGIFSASAAGRQNPLDDLFVAESRGADELEEEGVSSGAEVGPDSADVVAEVSDGGDGRRRRRRRGGRGGSAGRDIEDTDVTPPVVDSRRRVPGRSEPAISESVEEEDQIEFEVVDLAGGDLSGFWDASAESVPKLRHRQTPPPAEEVEPVRRPETGAGRAASGRSAASRSGGRPAPVPRDYEEDLEPEVPSRGGRGGGGRPAPVQRPAAEVEVTRPTRAARDVPSRDVSSRELPAREHSAREHSAREHSPREHSPREHSPREHSPREHSARDRAGRESVSGSSRGVEDAGLGSNRGRQRRGKPAQDFEPDLELDLPVERPVDRPSAGGSRRATTGRRPTPPAPPREEDDDDGYTVDNSWSPDDPRDEGAPKRRPVPAWRRVVDHIVDRNLSNRRGSDGQRRRGGGGGGRGSHASVAAQPRVRRDQVPTYLDEPSDISEADPFDKPEAPRGRAPRRGRSAADERGFEGRGPESGSSGGRRPADPDDFPEDRPRGRRRY